MKSRTLDAKGNSFVAIATLLLLAAGAARAAAPTPQATAPDAASGELQQLDEILVHGEAVRNRIADAEDQFFQLYNKLNKNDDYDTSCVFVNMDSQSKIKSRVCIPGFFADALADQLYFMMECQAPQSQTEPDGTTTDFSPGACYTPPSPQVVLDKRARDYSNNLMKVINSDPRLKNMAGNLDQLYTELLGIQQKYLRIKASSDASRAPAKAAEGPRVH